MKHGLWLGVAVLVGCSHVPSVRNDAAPPAVKQAIAETPGVTSVATSGAPRGRCPTELNQTEVVLIDRTDAVKMMFATKDPAQNSELHRRVTEVGKSLADVHPAVDAEGKRVEHVPTPAPELRKAEPWGSSPPQYAIELVVSTPSGPLHDRVRADFDEHMRHWVKGECPDLPEAASLTRSQAATAVTPATAGTPSTAAVAPALDR